MKIPAIQPNFNYHTNFRANEKVSIKGEANQNGFSFSNLDDDKKLAVKIIGGAIVIGGICYAGYRGVLGKSVQKFFRGEDLAAVNNVKDVAIPANVFERMGLNVSSEELSRYNKFKEDVDTVFGKEMTFERAGEELEILLKNNNINLELPFEQFSKKDLAYMDVCATKLYDKFHDYLGDENLLGDFLTKRFNIQVEVKDYSGAERSGRELVLIMQDVDTNIQGLKLMNKFAENLGEPKKYEEIFDIFVHLCIRAYKILHSKERSFLTNYQIECANSLLRLESEFAPVFGDNNEGIKAIRECISKSE